jgi:hypothetical protein
LRRSDYYPLGQYDQENDNEVKPLKTAGLFGLGYIDLSDIKFEKLKVRGNFIPSEIVAKMVHIPLILHRKEMDYMLYLILGMRLIDWSRDY